MKRLTTALLLGAFLTGCGGTNPFTDGTAGGTGETDPDAHVIPTALAGDLTSFTFDAAAGTLTVNGLTLDETQVDTSYRRRPGMDTAGYQAYTAQDDALDRHVTALVLQSGNSGSVRAGVVMSGGQFNRVFGGGYYERDGNFTPPTIGPDSGLVSYAGNYAGLTNLAGDAGDLLPLPAGTDISLRTSQAAETSGKVFLDVDFADNSLNGAIYDRVLVDSGQTLPSLILVATTIDDDGTFSGDRIEYDGILDINVGSYGGIFGGPDADAVGGVVSLKEFDGDGDPLGWEDEIEFGVFVLNQCGTTDEAAICDDVQP